MTEARHGFHERERAQLERHEAAVGRERDEGEREPGERYPLAHATHIRPARGPVALSRGPGATGICDHPAASRTARRPTCSTAGRSPGWSLARGSLTRSPPSRTPPCCILRAASLADVARPLSTS